ncbi:MAG: hypothetical protein HYZ96_04220 [Candidatus Omnitrophica bacterium]|nr:hypothetical protein [Candidatus Omnitrophota bacterium]
MGYNNTSEKVDRGRMAKVALERELATYREKLPELKAEEGKFVLIHGKDVIRTFTSYEDAIKEAYAEFGPNEPFLVKQIQTIEQAHFISRLFEPCRILPSK